MDIKPKIAKTNTEQPQHIETSNQTEKEGRGIFLWAMMISLALLIIDNIAGVLWLGYLFFDFQKYFPLEQWWDPSYIPYVAYLALASVIGTVILVRLFQWKKSAANLLIPYLIIAPILGIAIGMFILPREMLLILSWDVMLLCLVAIPYIAYVVLWHLALKRKRHLFA